MTESFVLPGYYLGPSRTYVVRTLQAVCREFPAWQMVSEKKIMVTKGKISKGS